MQQSMPSDNIPNLLYPPTTVRVLDEYASKPERYHNVDHRIDVVKKHINGSQIWLNHRSPSAILELAAIARFFSPFLQLRERCRNCTTSHAPRRSRCSRRGFNSDEHAGQAARGDGVGEVTSALAVDGGECLTGGGVDEVGGG